MDNICCIISLQGFNLEGGFLARELAWINFDTGKTGCCRFNLASYNRGLSQKDRQTIRFSENKLHGLQFSPANGEKVLELDQLESELLRIHQECKKEDKDEIAYKGSHTTKNMLDKLKIPSIKLEEFGCPKYNIIAKKCRDRPCSYHANNLPCSISEVSAFRTWALGHKHEFELVPNEENDNSSSSDD